MKIYTKTGDKGKTSLFDGTRIPKNNIRVETYGTIDELNAVLGIVIANLENTDEYKKDFQKNLTTMQQDLFEIGARLANPKSKLDTDFCEQLANRTEVFEEYIDEMTSELPELTNFILPGGGKVGSLLQLARTVCRRAERQVVSLARQDTVDNEILMYLNRLSDLFHTMSRFANLKEKKKEIIWNRK